MNRTFQRRRILVDKGLQGRLCLAGLLHGGVVLAAMVLGILAPIVLELSAAQPRRYEEQAIVMLYLHERLPWVLLVGALVVVAASLRQSHRIAGPLVRFKRNLRLLGEGMLPPTLHTRRRDLLKEEVACLNAAVDGVADRVGAIQDAQVEVRAAVADLLDASVDPDDRRLQALLRAVRGVDARLAAFTDCDPDAEAAPTAAAVAKAEAVAASAVP